MSNAFEKQSVEEGLFLDVLRRALEALEASEVPYAIIGGVASAIYGRPRYTLDVDVLVRHDDAGRAIEALDAAGFDTERTDPLWLYKAVSDGVVVDVLFSSSGDVYLDEEMSARSRVEEFRGLRMRVAPPEDVVVMKAIAHAESTPRYWHDALGIIARTPLDWDYLLRRARLGAHRVMSLLSYAASNDIVVPAWVMRTLFESMYAPERPKEESWRILEAQAAGSPAKSRSRT